MARFSAVDFRNPQSWNRYTYVRNSPLTLVDPGGTVDINPGFTYEMMGAEGSGGFDCQVDGLDASCQMAYAELQGGGAAQCPENNCGIGTSTPYQCLDAVCGYMSNQYVATHENEWNGVLYSNAEWATFLTDAVDAQRQALADAIVAANPNLTYDNVYSNLQYDHTQGGNANFVYLGDLNDLSFIPDYDTGGGNSSREGGIPSIHMPGATDDGLAILHLDSANPLWGFGLGAFLHGLIDVGFGNINPRVPMGPW